MKAGNINFDLWEGSVCANVPQGGRHYSDSVESFLLLAILEQLKHMNARDDHRD